MYDRFNLDPDDVATRQADRHFANEILKNLQYTSLRTCFRTYVPRPSRDRRRSTTNPMAFCHGQSVGEAVRAHSITGAIQ